MRKSLAPMSSSSMNARASLAPGRASMAPSKIGSSRTTLNGRTSSIGGRQSLAPGGRRSTLAAGGKQLEDPRNVRDKMFIRAGQQRVIEFLVENNYDSQISAKQLEAPTAKDFAKILTFLYNKIDPKFVFVANNLPDEVPPMFKRLRYPFNISKSHLQAVGSPHAWPSLLAATVWLVELLQYEKTCEQAKEDDVGEENSDRIFFDFLAKAYSSFLQGTDADNMMLENELATSFDTKNSATQEELARVSKANEKMEEEIVQLSESKLEGLQEKRNLLIKDLDKFKLLIANLEKHLQDVEKKTQELGVDAQMKEQELRSAETERDELAQIIATQESNNVDAIQLTSERQLVMDALRQTGQEKERIQNLIYDAEVQLANKQAELERHINEYNELARELKIVPSTAKYANGIEYDIPLASRGNNIDQLIALGGRSALKQDLTNLHSNLNVKVREVNQDRLVHEEMEHETASHLEEKRREVRLMEEDCRNRELNLQKDKEVLDQELKIFSSEVQAIEEQLAAGANGGKMRYNAAKKRVEDLQVQLQNASQILIKKRQQGVDTLISICSIVAQHKCDIQERLQSLEESASLIQQHIATA